MKLMNIEAKGDFRVDNQIECSLLFDFDDGRRIEKNVLINYSASPNFPYQASSIKFLKRIEILINLITKLDNWQTNANELNFQSQYQFIFDDIENSPEIPVNYKFVSNVEI